MADTSSRNRRIMIAVTAAIAALAIVVPLAAALLSTFADRPSAAPLPTPTTTKPNYTIKPLAVRPVISAEGTVPDQCPPPGPTPPAEPLRTCDITRTAVYDLGPEEARLQLTDADSFLSPLTNAYIVQIAMTPESTQDFARVTGAHVGGQLAFVRAGQVVVATNITAPIDGEVLQLSADIPAERSNEMARMLRDEA